jgi:hygromycin-B 4-O-kinase
MHGQADERAGALHARTVRALLVDRLGGPITKLERIGYGEWSKAFRFRCAETDFIARFGAFDEDFLKDQRVMDYASPALPVPTILEVGRAFSGYYAISKRLPGTFIEQLDAAGLVRVLPALLRALDAMRDVDLGATRGFGVWHADGNAPHATWRDALLDVARDRPTDRVHGWRPRIGGAPSGEAAFTTALAELEVVVDTCPNERYLVHSDLLNFNLLVADDQVSGVIDWGSALYGDFLWDVAWFTFWQPWYPAWRGVDIAAAARRHLAAVGADVVRYDERMRACELAIGLDGMRYQAFTNRWSDLEATARRTLDVARR